VRLRCVAAQRSQSNAEHVTHLQLGLQSRSVLHEFFVAFFLGLILIARLGRTFASRCYLGSPNPDFDNLTTRRRTDGTISAENGFLSSSITQLVYHFRLLFHCSFCKMSWQRNGEASQTGELEKMLAINAKDAPQTADGLYGRTSAVLLQLAL